MAAHRDMSNELRGMVREVLRDTLARQPGTAGQITESVRIGSDAELAAFVARVLEPATQDRLRSGLLRFSLAGPSTALQANATPALTGVVSERIVDRHACGGTLVLAADAVMTPLARERARKLGLKIERRR